MRIEQGEMVKDNAGPTLSVQGIAKRYGDVKAVDDVSFTADGGSFLSLLGPSGSGKTTVLRLICGFEPPERGVIRIRDRDVTHIPPYRRDIGVVFQSYALFPHMSIADNVAFPLRQRRVPAAKRNKLVNEMLETVGLPGRGEQYPSHLSGGEQQRVALARALVFRPSILVMDEPLSALDKRLRERMQEEIRGLQQQFGVTTVYVTHDQSEAFVMSDTVAVMQNGKIEQLGRPRDLYEHPENEFVARFLGDSNVLSGDVAPGDEDTTGVELEDSSVIRCFTNSKAESGTLKLLVRPESIRINAAAAEDTHNILRGRVKSIAFVGEFRKYKVSAANMEILVHEQNQPGRDPVHEGTDVILSWRITDTIAL